MVSPHAIFRSSLEYVFHGFGNQMSLMAAAVTISRLLKDLVPALGGPVKIFSLLSPAPSPFFLLETPVYWQTVVVGSLKKSCLLPWLLVLETGEKLPTPSNYRFMPSWVCSEPYGCLRCQPAGIRQANVFIVSLCERG